MLEGATDEDKAAGMADALRIYTVRDRAFDDGFLRYRMEDPAHALGDFIQVNRHEALVVERDNGQGATAVWCRSERRGRGRRSREASGRGALRHWRTLRIWIRIP